MTGPEHYLAAEELLLTADAYEQDSAPLTAASRRAEAQVHATLALAAATALAVLGADDGLPTADYRAWNKAVSAAAPTGGASE